MKTGSNSPSIRAPRRKGHQQKAASHPSFHLGIIFEKDTNGNYTARSRLYQDIISYALMDRHGEAFLFNDIAKFVIQKNSEYRKHYSGSQAHVPMSARISNRRDTIQKCINDLQEIGLIGRLGFTRALKNNIPTPKYAFSSDGKIIALLLQRLDLAKKQDADEKIFQLFKSAYNFRNDSAANRLQVKLLERLKLDGLLGELLDMVTDYLSNLHELMRILDVLGIMIIGAFHNPRTTRKVWSSYVATFNDIDRKTCRILFRCEKIRLENNIASGSRFRTKEWEDLLIDNVTDDSKIVLAGACKNCLKASPIVVDYLKYLKGILTSEERMYATTCPKCKSQRTFYILPGKDSKELQKLQMLRFL